MASNKNLTPLSDHLCFSLYATSRAIQRLYNPSLEKYNLTGSVAKFPITPDLL